MTTNGSRSFLLTVIALSYNTQPTVKVENTGKPIYWSNTQMPWAVTDETEE